MSESNKKVWSKVPIESEGKKTHKKKVIMWMKMDWADKYVSAVQNCGEKNFLLNNFCIKFKFSTNVRVFLGALPSIAVHQFFSRSCRIACSLPQHLPVLPSCWRLGCSAGIQFESHYAYLCDVPPS